MPAPDQKQLASGVTTNGAQKAFDVRNLTAMSVFVKATGGTSVDFTLEGTADPNGVLGFGTLAMRGPGGGPYAVTAINVAASAGKSAFLDPVDNIQWIRINFANNGTTADAWLNGEV